MNYRIGTRGSELARKQTEIVRARLAAAYPNDTFKVVVIRTRGDRITNRSIAELNDRSLFTGEIERALQAGKIDLAVHSMKDLPAECADGLCLAKAWPREDPRDVLVVRGKGTSLDDLPEGAHVGCGSPRRRLQLSRLSRFLKYDDIRGNVNTRLRKLFAPQDGEPKFDAIVLAAAGLKRLGLEEKISSYFPIEDMIPAPNQGTLAIELRKADKDLKAKLDALGDDDAECVARTERGLLKELGVDCHSPIGAFAQIVPGGVRLRAVFALRDTCRAPSIADVDRTAPTPEEVIAIVAREIRQKAGGNVVLVGAGPGDPGLMTVKGRDALQCADAVVYDHLVSTELLREVRPLCETVYVGKQSGKHLLPQEEINLLLERLAMRHPTVVRLKGGDPFVFGRGGEEMDYLLSRGVRCSVIPGVTSAVAVPELAGIPVTHRGLSRGFEVVTAHAQQNQSPKIDFTRLVAAERTIIFMMGLAQVAKLARGLRDAGMSAEMPAAVISSGSTSREKCVVGTLTDIARRTKQAGVESPAILVVGEVVRLRSKLGFPLTGRRFLLPEIRGSAGKLRSLLERLGADVETVVVGRIEPIEGILTEAALEGVTGLAFTSRHAAEMLTPAVDAVLQRHDFDLAAVGEGTGTVLVAHGHARFFTPDAQTAAGLEREWKPLLKPGSVILHPTAAHAHKLDFGSDIKVRELVVYRNAPVRLTKPIDLSRYDGAVFTCSSSASRLLGKATGKTKLFAIGPSTAQTLTDAARGPVLTSARPRPEDLAALVTNTFNA